MASFPALQRLQDSFLPKPSRKGSPVQLLKHKIVYIKPTARKFLLFGHPGIPCRWTKKTFHPATMFQNEWCDVPVIQCCIWCLWASAVCSLICSHLALHFIKFSISVGSWVQVFGLVTCTQIFPALLSIQQLQQAPFA